MSERLAPALADAFVLIAALASEAGIDLESAVEQKFFSDDVKRVWRSAGDAQQSRSAASWRSAKRHVIATLDSATAHDFQIGSPRTLAGRQ